MTSSNHSSMIGFIRNIASILDRNDLHYVFSGILSKAEQVTIVKQLENSILKLDLQVEKITKLIVHLQECRSILITNAVTGKIDVRNSQ